MQAYNSFFKHNSSREILHHITHKKLAELLLAQYPVVLVFNFHLVSFAAIVMVVTL